MLHVVAKLRVRDLNVSSPETDEEELYYLTHFIHENAGLQRRNDLSCILGASKGLSEAVQASKQNLSGSPARRLGPHTISTGRRVAGLPPDTLRDKVHTYSAVPHAHTLYKYPRACPQVMLTFTQSTQADICTHTRSYTFTCIVTLTHILSEHPAQVTLPGTTSTWQTVPINHDAGPRPEDPVSTQGSVEKLCLELDWR